MRILKSALQLLTLCRLAGAYVPPYEQIPSTPVLPTPVDSGYVNLTDVDIWYAHFGPAFADSARPPVVFLHGGFGNSDYFGLQIQFLLDTVPDVAILSIDSRMQGRSGGVFGEISYALMREDVLGVMDYHGISKAAIVGWSDGGIIALSIAINAPERLDRAYCFGASYRPANTNETILDSAFGSVYLPRTRVEYAALSPHPTEFDLAHKKIFHMFDTLPHFSKERLAKIPTPFDDCANAPLMWIVDGSQEEAIKHGVARRISRRIAGSGLLYLPDVSHFAFIQDPEMFDLTMLRWLNYERVC